LKNPVTEPKRSQKSKRPLSSTLLSEWLQYFFNRSGTDLMAGANQITDRYLVALARHHGFSLATLDEPLVKSFADQPHLVELVQ
jgi:predicted nucleic acid-binding protein